MRNKEISFLPFLMVQIPVSTCSTTSQLRAQQKNVLRQAQATYVKLPLRSLLLLPRAIMVKASSASASNFSCLVQETYFKQKPDKKQEPVL